MPIKGTGLTMHFYATDTDGGKTGQTGSEITLKLVLDGVVTAVAATLAEVDATNFPGLYKVALSNTENNANVITLGGKSSTSGVSVAPITWTNIVPASAEAATTLTKVTSILTDTGTTLNDKVDVIDGIVDAIKVAADAILVDTGTTLNTKIDTIDGVVDSIKVVVDANSTEIGVIDGIVDDILVDTGTTLEGKIDQVDSVVDAIKVAADAILVDTGTTLNDKVDVVDGIVDAIKVAADAILVDTGTTLENELVDLRDVADDILTDTGFLRQSVEVGEVYGTPSTTVIVSDTSALSAVDDNYNCRLMIATSGALKGQVQEITDYVGSSKTFTTTAWTTALADNDDFIIV